ncbi:MAG: redox-sensing transcriptional repressor Rex [Gaiellales bacterium]
MADRLGGGVAARMAHYLQVLTQAKKAGRSAITSHEISEYTHVNATQIRRDLSGFGTFGKRGVGYSVDALIGEISGILRTAGQHNIVLVGAGHLGQAIAQADVFADHGFSIVGVFDADPALIGTPCGRLTIQSPAELEESIAEHQVIVGVVAVPAGAAQEVADDLVAAGVRIVFNYSGALIDVPPHVTAHTTSPAVELLYALYFHLA